MSTIAQTAARVQPNAYPVLVIGHGAYDVEPIESNDPSILAAIRLTKCFDDMAHYNISAGLLGCTCDCPSFEMREGPLGRTCKHIRACYAAGLLAPAIITLDAEGRVIDVSRADDEPADADPAADFRSWADAMDRAHAEEVGACGSGYDDAPADPDDADPIDPRDREWVAADDARLQAIEDMSAYYESISEERYEAIREAGYPSGRAFPDEISLAERVEILGAAAYEHCREGN